MVFEAWINRKDIKKVSKLVTQTSYGAGAFVFVSNFWFSKRNYRYFVAYLSCGTQNHSFFTIRRACNQ